jgi:hypothetical protein
MILQDSSLVFWLVGVTDSGILTTTVVGSGPATPTILKDQSNASLWNMVVSTTGNLETVSVGSGSSVAYVVLYSSPSSIQWNMAILPLSGGILDTTFVGSVQAGIVSSGYDIFQSGDDW